MAQAVPFQWLRQHIKEIIGPDCIFVVLSMSEETQAKRVEKRYAHFDEGLKKWVLDLLTGMAKQYDIAGDDEENAVNVHINPDDTEEDVIEKIMSAVQPYLWNKIWNQYFYFLQLLELAWYHSSGPV